MSEPREPHYLTSAEAAAYVRKTLHGFDHWVAKEGIPCGRAGNIRLYTKDMLDRVIRNGGLRPRRRRKTVAPEGQKPE